MYFAVKIVMGLLERYSDFDWDIEFWGFRKVEGIVGVGIYFNYVWDFTFLPHFARE